MKLNRFLTNYAFCYLDELHQKYRKSKTKLRFIYILFVQQNVL